MKPMDPQYSLLARDLLNRKARIESMGPLTSQDAHNIAKLVLDTFNETMLNPKPLFPTTVISNVMGPFEYASAVAGLEYKGDITIPLHEPPAPVTLGGVAAVYAQLAYAKRACEKAA